MAVCDVCGKKYREDRSSGLFTVYKSGLHPLAAHIHMCLDCAVKVKNFIAGLLENRRD